MRPIKPNSIVRGEVVRLAGNQVWIAVDAQARAAVSLQEFHDETLGAVVPPRPGAVVAVLIEAVDEKTGALVLSYRKAKRVRSPSEDLAWRRICEGHVKAGDVIAATVLYRREGGPLKVSFTFRVGSAAYEQDACLPTSELQWPDYADYYVGNTVQCKVLDIDTVLGTVVVSERKLLEGCPGGATTDATDGC